MLSVTKSEPTSVNPRWVVTVMKGRGIHDVPAIPAVDHALNQMTHEARLAFRELVMKVHQGTDASGELESLAEWGSTVTPQPSISSKKPAAETIRPEKPRAANDSPINRERESSAMSAPAREPSHHVYGSKAALCIELTSAKNNGSMINEIEAWTVQLEMAPAMTKGRYDWDRKIIFRLTQRELPLLAAVLFGWVSQVVMSNHGPGNDKELTVEDQGGHLFVKLRQGKKAIAVPVGGDELFATTSLALKALSKNAPHLDSQTLLQMIKRGGQMYAKSVGITA